MDTNYPEDETPEQHILRALKAVESHAQSIATSLVVLLIQVTIIGVAFISGGVIALGYLAEIGAK